MRSAIKMFTRLLGKAIVLLGFALVSEAGAQTWIQLSPTADPTYGTPSPRIFNSTVYNTANKRLIVFGGGGSGGFGLLNDVWVLTDADGAAATPAWIKLNPGGALPGARELHVAVYDQANNRMIVHGGYTQPGFCEGVIGDVWVLSNADGTGGLPAWTQLAPTGTAPGRRLHAAAYDAVSNRLIVNGGMSSGCGPGVNDTWVLTNANGLGGTPEWIQLTPTAPGDFPSDTQGGNTGYDPATNTFIRFLAIGGTVSTWLLENGNGLGGSPAWSKLAVSPEAVVLGAFNGGGVYDPATNTFTFFGGGSGVRNETWTLANANGAGTAEWAQISPAGTLPDPRVWSFAAYTPETDRLTIYGGSKDGYNPTGEVWVLTDIGLNHPPVANAGADQTVDATSPAGALVTLDGTGSSDPDEDTLTFSWTGPFGTAAGATPTVLVPVGMHIISLTVTDPSGETSLDTVAVTVRSAAEMTSSLTATATALDFQQAVKLLGNVVRQIDAGNLEAGCNQLNAFINQVQAQSGKQLTADEADQLIASASQIKAALGCP